MIALISPRLWAAVVLSIILAFAGFTVYRAGKASVRAEWNAQTAKDLTAAREKEQALQAKADQNAKEKDDQIRTIGARLDVALGELRKRPQRPAVVPENSSACRSGTGAGLFRDDAELLSRLAARADTIAAERDACYKQYEQIRSTAGQTP